MLIQIVKAFFYSLFCIWNNLIFTQAQINNVRINEKQKSFDSIKVMKNFSFAQTLRVSKAKKIISTMLLALSKLFTLSKEKDTKNVEGEKFSLKMLKSSNKSLKINGI